MHNNKDKKVALSNQTNFYFNMKSGLVVIGLVHLIGELLLDSLNWMLALFGFTLIVIGNILVYFHENWTKRQVRDIVWFQRFLAIFMPVAIIIFFIRNSFNYNSLIYVLLLSVYVFVQMIVARKLITNKNRDVGRSECN